MAQQQQQAQNDGVAVAAAMCNGAVDNDSCGLISPATRAFHPIACAATEGAVLPTHAALIPGYIRNDPTAAMSRVTGAHSDETELAMVREWCAHYLCVFQCPKKLRCQGFVWLQRVSGLDDDDVHTIYRQDVDGSFSQAIVLPLAEKRERLVAHIAALQREDNELQGRYRPTSGETARDGAQAQDYVTIGWLTWTHKDITEFSGDEVVLDVAGCQ